MASYQGFSGMATGDTGRRRPPLFQGSTSVQF